MHNRQNGFLDLIDKWQPHLHFYINSKKAAQKYELLVHSNSWAFESVSSYVFSESIISFWIKIKKLQFFPSYDEKVFELSSRLKSMEEKMSLVNASKSLLDASDLVNWRDFNMTNFYMND